MKYEAEILLMEECGELTQALSKVIRTEARADMLDNLAQELADVLLLIDFIREKYGYESSELNRRMADKKHKLERWSSLYVA